MLLAENYWCGLTPPICFVKNRRYQLQCFLIFQFSRTFFCISSVFADPKAKTQAEIIGVLQSIEYKIYKVRDACMETLYFTTIFLLLSFHFISKIFRRFQKGKTFTLKARPSSPPLSTKTHWGILGVRGTQLKVVLKLLYPASATPNFLPYFLTPF